MTADEFALRLTRDCAVMSGAHVLAAVSGGADSVALLCLLGEVKEKLHLTVSCAHVEHGIRGDKSLGDMDFVRSLCARFQIPFYAAQVNAPEAARCRGMGLEEAARALRYAALESIAQRIDADAIALAHHAQDQAETVLLHAARGSDVRGLCAMSFRRGNLIRPLLGETPDALRAYLMERGETWREDETNGDLHFARNRIRGEVIPAIEAAYPGAVRALCRLAEAARRDETHFERLLSALDIPVRPLVDGAAIERAPLLALDDALLSRYLYAQLGRAGLGGQSAQKIEAVIGAVRRGGETVNLTGGYAVAGAETVCLIRHQEPLCDTPLAIEGETVTPFGVFSVRRAQPGETGDGRICQVIPEDMLRGACVSQRRPGDAMIPFGRRESVKLKKLVIEAGVERPLRNSLPVIRRGETILWAVTIRPSAHCRVSGDGAGCLVTFKASSYTKDSELSETFRGL